MLMIQIHYNNIIKSIIVKDFTKAIELIFKELIQILPDNFEQTENVKDRMVDINYIVMLKKQNKLLDFLEEHFLDYKCIYILSNDSKDINICVHKKIEEEMNFYLL